jgi:single-strand DNA-binding protein
MNRVTLLGRLGADPELVKTKTGMSVTNISLATNRTSKGQEVTDWHKIVLFDKKAEVAEKYLIKGMQVIIEGCLTYNKYESDGQVKYQTTILGNHLHFVGGKPGEVKDGLKDKIDLNNIEDGLPF